ncbi:phosphoglucomutase [Raphidocelis subcapitata]|uniref:phosphoglucomutase (alpha-D-glucose-1,6-bisphosphate-dependent) n=1 Tax=Raphidocelis subcapitata TaxID=307507 RepID=A0A2V0PQF0_9CHLO|nr:phosphoglucomutase [Raphidocelis subcapitata]|eukprot:GBF99435.1 phosphoglucomutase [Raphidocelis subcapitata]
MSPGRGSGGLITPPACARGCAVRRPAARRAVPRVAAYLAAGPTAATADTLAAFKRLQNGSDIRGVGLKADPSHVVTLTPAAAYFIGRAFVRFLRGRAAPSDGAARMRVCVGSDPRLSGPLLRAALLTGLADEGAEVEDAGLSTTPAMFYSIIAPGSRVTGAVMMTASHMPLQNNGLKFFTAGGGLEKRDIASIVDAAGAMCADEGVVLNDPTSDTAFVLNRAIALPAIGTKVPLLEAYSSHLRSLIIEGVAHADHPNKPLEGLHIVVDAGNGSGGFFADQVLAPLGADVSGSQFLEPDGSFPNHIPNPENADAMAAAVEAVKKSGADLGIIFDTDVDRSGIVDSMGNPINSNRFIALMAAITLRDHPGTTIVTDSVTSNGLTSFIEGLGGQHCRFKRGYRNVINKGIELNEAGVDCELMMETSGHGALRENRYLDDGAYMAVKAVIELVRLRMSGCDITNGGCDLTALLRELREPAEAGEYRIKIKDADFKPVGAAVLEGFKAWLDKGAGGESAWSLDPVNHEGWRVSVDEGAGARGWALLRASLHDPLLVLNVESDVPGGVAKIRGHLLESFLSRHKDALDLSAL